jgi:hypothetical protein
VGGLMAELNDPAAAGDDYGLVIAFAVGLVVSIIIYSRARERTVLTEPVRVENDDNPR